MFYTGRNRATLYSLSSVNARKWPSIHKGVERRCLLKTKGSLVIEAFNSHYSNRFKVLLLGLRKEKRNSSFLSLRLSGFFQREKRGKRTKDNRNKKKVGFMSKMGISMELKKRTVKSHFQLFLCSSSGKTHHFVSQMFSSLSYVIILTFFSFKWKTLKLFLI